MGARPTIQRAVNRPAQPMSIAPRRGLDRLQGHCLLVGRMTSPDGHAAALTRLELELGPELARLLVAALSARPT